MTKTTAPIIIAFKPCQCYFNFLQLTQWSAGRESRSLHRPLLSSSSLSRLGHILTVTSILSRFIFYYIVHYSIIHLWFWSGVALCSSPLPLRQMFYLVCCCPFLPPFIPLSLYFSFIILYPLYHWFNLTLYDWPSVPGDPTSRMVDFSLRLGNDTPHSETGTGQPLVVQRGHFKWCFLLLDLKCSGSRDWT